jgi:hypothetical protein
MKTNFEIEENYTVQLNGIHIDLHNNFEFNEISEFDNAVRIEFIKSTGDWVHKTATFNTQPLYPQAKKKPPHIQAHLILLVPHKIKRAFTPTLASLRNKASG